ncbi:right-handed parallel beta-helix repeat-containing protein [Lentimicrobium sp. S6]|uniref:right-handed parallel beta-helix repeat-containing protein n=1 Tax=Lentimicrobium sp. S6 TaxID=2735872 RepID=UPI00155611DD|nr:right-handed parallel beta-helix repeat-containing protein [Lentimicrobium sp. S6]NPD44538.1 hypothetical protein [Lentimicrobium sp. S6]
MQNHTHIIHSFKWYFNIAFFAISIWFASCQFQDTNDGLRPEIYCSVDSTALDEDNVFWYDSGMPLINQNMKLGGFLSSKESHSGVHSVLLTKEKAYGLSTDFENIKGDERFLVSVWRKGNSEGSALVVQGDIVKSLWIGQKEAIEIGENDWEKIEIEVQIPPNISLLKVYVWNINGDSVYFDDLRIKELGVVKYPDFKDDEKVHLYFSDSKMKKFNEKRYNAFMSRIHFSDGEWMKGVMSDENRVMPIKARLKGDWLDHLEGQKWSFRTKMRDDHTFKRMRVFSLQNPVTRYFVHEYFAHQLFNQEDVLTTRYGFTPVYLNGQSIGIYAYEEHFAKQLIEYNLRREGPILKIDENPLWRERQKEMTTDLIYNYPYYEAAKVGAFGLSKTLAKPNLKSQFEIAHSLVYQYKNLLSPVEELFNVDVLARYWALIDITNGRHGIVWHNQRLYFNPVICKLEPIDFDNFTDYYDEEEEPILSAFIMNKNWIGESEHQMLKHIFTSKVFLDKYLFYLEKYTDPIFLQEFIDSELEETSRYTKLIAEEFTTYDFDPHFIMRNAEILRPQLPKLRDSIESGVYDKTELIVENVKGDTTYLPAVIPFFVNAYYSQEQLGIANIKVENFFGKEIEVLGLADENSKMLYLFESPFYVQAYQGNMADTTIEYRYTSNANQLAYRVIGHEEILFSELSLFRKNTNPSPYQELLRNFNIETCELFEDRGDSLIVRGIHELTSKVLVPKGKVVVFEAGAQVNILNEGTIISHSPVYMLGTKEQPIKIYSTDTTANAFIVLQANKRSLLSHVVFEDLNTLEYDGWNLTGAVNFYESDVDITNCSFLKNHCEDALNIIRSDFHVTKSKFEDIYADAFDSDFCTGLLDYSSFDRVGNDAIDFSTSQIYIENCEITNIQDKGISGGEGSTLWVKNTNITNCNIGAASKDLSHVSIENVNIENCYYGLVALRKKPEYGTAVFDTKKLKLVNCQVKHLIEKNSVLNYNGRKIEGTREKVAEMFY